MFRYKAFISYSHEDEVWASWLHQQLEAFEVPDTVSPSRRLGTVFRDREEFSASRDLSRAIDQALTDSEAMIVICSPACARSIWVACRVIFWRENLRLCWTRSSPETWSKQRQRAHQQWINFILIHTTDDIVFFGRATSNVRRTPESATIGACYGLFKFLPRFINFCLLQAINNLRQEISKCSLVTTGCDAAGW